MNTINIKLPYPLSEETLEWLMAQTDLKGACKALQEVYDKTVIATYANMRSVIGAAEAPEYFYSFVDAPVSATTTQPEISIDITALEAKWQEHFREMVADGHRQLLAFLSRQRLI